LAGAKNGQNFGLKTCWAKFQLWSSIDSFSSDCYCYCFCFIEKMLLRKIRLGLMSDYLAKTLRTYFFVLISILADVTTPGCEPGTEQKTSRHVSWFQQDDRRRRSLPLVSPLTRTSCFLSMSSRRFCMLGMLIVLQIMSIIVEKL
jgi:hypothetical protein